MIKRNQYHWPSPSYCNIPYHSLIQKNHFQLKPIALPIDIVNYTLFLCQKLKLELSTFQLTLSIASRYLLHKANILPLQLVMLSSLMISCKFIETNPPQLSTLHKMSNNSFTNRDMYRTQMLILRELKFDITAQGFPNHQIQLVVTCVKSLLRSEQSSVFPSIIQDITQLMWVYLYTGRLKTRQFKVIPATLIHLGLIFLTQFSGRFLPTMWAIKLTGVDEKEVIRMSKKFLKQMLGQQKSKEYKF